MVRIQLHLTEAQDRQLRTQARRRKVTRAELIRRGIDLVLAEDQPGEDPLLGLVGLAGPGGPDDISERHDDYLYRIEPAAPPMAAERKPEEE